MREVAIKTHLIIQSVHDEYHMSWQGKIINTKPKFKDDKLSLIIRHFDVLGDNKE